MRRPPAPSSSLALAPAEPVRAAARPVNPMPTATPAPKTAPTARSVTATAGGRWKVQLGAYASPAAARGQWTAISRKVGALGGLQPSYEAAGKFTRLRVGPLGDRSAADRLCGAAKAAGQACFTVAPGA